MIWPEIDALFIALFDDIQIGVSDSRLDISTNTESKNQISIYQSLYLVVDNKKQFRF